MEFYLKDIQASVTLTYPDLNELNIELVPPTGSGLPTITLLNNRNTLAGNSILTTANVGAMVGSMNIGPAIFGSPAAATHSLYNTSGGANTVGTFLAEGTGTNGSTDQGLDAAYLGALQGQVDGTWNLQITNYGEHGTSASTVTQFKLKITDDTGFTLSGENTIGTTAVLGQYNEGVFPNSKLTLVSPVGIGPAPMIASDNTFGAFSPY